MPHGLFIIMEFDSNTRGVPVEPPIVYLEGGPAQDVYLEKAEEIRLYSELASVIGDKCLGEVESRDLLRRGKELRAVNGDLSEANWFKSSRSASGSQCVEVAWLGGGMIGVRDSKNPTGPALVFAPRVWDAFTTSVQDGGFNRPLTA
ncbi:hypothetical protein NG2371_02024 [Nocardia gamkensis]|nr:hypothetical protein [Nocardia gamkensis]